MRALSTLSAPVPLALPRVRARRQPQRWLCRRTGAAGSALHGRCGGGWHSRIRACPPIVRESRHFGIGREAAIPHISGAHLVQEAHLDEICWMGRKGNAHLSMATLEITPRKNRADSEPVLEAKSRSFPELQSLTGLHGNDLWSLHSQRFVGRAQIEPRAGRAILVRLGAFQAALLADRCVLFAAKHTVVDLIAQAILVPLAERDLTDESARGFEIDCLDAVLGTTQRRLRRRAHCFVPVVERLLGSVVSKEPEASLAQLLNVSRALVALERSCTSIVTCLEEAMAKDEEVEELLLSARAAHAEGAPPELLEAVKDMLESYVFEFKSISDQLFLSLSAIESTQQTVRMALEQKRTDLLALNVHLTIATLSIGIVAAFGGLLGMNVPLPGGIGEHPVAFYHVCCVAGVTAIGTHAASLVAMSRGGSRAAKLRQAHDARKLAQRLPELADVLLKRLEAAHINDGSSPGDAALTLKEFSVLVQRETTLEGADAKELKYMFQTLDHNRDGRLQLDDIAELLCTLSSGPPPL